MTRHVFPRALLTAACVLGLLAVVRAQDGDGPQPEKVDTSGRVEPAAADGADTAAPEAAGAETPDEPETTVPAVGAAFPASLPLRPLPRAGDATSSEGEQGEAPPATTLAELVGAEPRPLILVFWSGRCVVCKRYGAVLEKLAAAFGDEVRIVLVASGAEETAEAVREARASAGLQLATFLDTDKETAGLLGVRVTPTAFLVDAEGVLRYRGPIDDDRRARSRDARELLRPAIAAVVAGKDVENGDVRPFGSALR